MGYLPSHKSCCIPVRFSVFILTTLGCIGGSILAGFGWYSALHKEETYLTQNQNVSVVIASFSYTVLAATSLVGLIGTIIRRRALVSLYSTVTWSHLALNIVAGAYFIYTLFHKVGKDDLNNCIFFSDDQPSQDECEKEFGIYRGVIICLYVVFCLLELGVCLVVANYVMQLREDEVLDYYDYPPPAQTAATVPSMATTYGHRKEYAFSQSSNSISV